MQLTTHTHMHTPGNAHIMHRGTYIYMPAHRHAHIHIYGIFLMISRLTENT